MCLTIAFNDTIRDAILICNLAGSDKREYSERPKSAVFANYMIAMMSTVSPVCVCVVVVVVVVVD